MRFSVEFSDEAVSDLISSLEWGIDNWGERQAFHWYSNIRESVVCVLGRFPLSQPIAPDSEEYEIEVRQMVITRYRILFTIQNKIVTVLHIRGPYAGENR